MVRKIWILGICMVFFLTGCGIPDAVAEELRIAEEPAGVDGSKEDGRAFEKVMRQGESHTEPTVISQRMGSRLDALAGFLENVVKEKKIAVIMEEDEYTANSAFDQEAGIIYGGLKDWRDETSTDNFFLGYGTEISSFFRIGTEDAAGLLEGLEELGYEGLELPGHEEGGSCIVVSQGVEFDITYICFQDIEPYYQFMITVPVMTYSYPKKYADLLENYMGDSFYAMNIVCGGYLEYIGFEGSRNHPQNNYEKKVEIYFKEEKPIQTNVMISVNDSEKEGEVFTEAEKKDLTGLLTWLSGDAKASEAFIAGFGVNKEKEGKIGSLEWYRAGSLGSGECLLRFQ